jgi:hypothetical protein
LDVARCFVAQQAAAAAVAPFRFMQFDFSSLTKRFHRQAFSDYALFSFLSVSLCFFSAR